MPQHIRSTAQPVDRARAIRLLTAWLTGDKVAVDHTLLELRATRPDDNGAVGCLFGILDCVVELVEQGDDEQQQQVVEVLRAALIRDELDHGDADQ